MGSSTQVHRSEMSSPPRMPGQSREGGGLVDGTKLQVWVAASGEREGGEAQRERRPSQHPG